jgi:hypothetical protein
LTQHYRALTEEPEFTGVVAGVIEDRLREYRFGDLDLDVEVMVQPLPARTLESDVGADLYISIVRKDGPKPVSKGMLVQSKWDDTVGTAGAQARTMVERSPEGSYVWAYGPHGIDVIPAHTVAEGLPPPPLDEQPTVGGLIAGGIQCTAGDPAIGRQVEGDRIESLNAAMERLRVPVGMGFTVGRRR